MVFKFPFISTLFLGVFFFAFSSFISAQEGIKIFEDEQLFTSELEIVNGEKWNYQQRYAGHPFWKSNLWYEGKVEFDGTIHAGLALKYNIESNDLIMIKEVNNEARIYKLNKAFVEGFEIMEPGLKKIHHFRYIELPGIDGKKFYQQVYSGNTECFIYQKKIVSNKIRGNFAGEYLYQPVIYIKLDGTFQACQNTRSFLRLFDNNKKRLRRYMRQNKLEIDGENPGDIARLLTYYDSLNPQSN